MNHYKTLIVDDEPAARNIIRTLLSEKPEFSIVDEATNGSKAVVKILHHRPDLLFQDIQMPRLDGFSMLQKVWPEYQPMIVFTTAYNQYALRAFEVSAVDYLLKPFDEIRFGQAIHRARERLHSRRFSRIETLLQQLTVG